MNDRVMRVEENLRHVCYKVKMKGREMLNEYGITPPQFDALLVLRRNQDMSISDLSQKLFLASSTLTDLLDRMERNELILRKKDVKDRRCIRVNIAPRGLEIIQMVMKTRQEYIQSLLDPMMESEIENLDRSMILLNEKVKL
ncbi:MAG: MarR family transcriptional regulator [Bacillota bacterium]|nr:MarR family transcriptional regulator [Bacillota bacterium]